MARPRVHGQRWYRAYLPVFVFGIQLMKTAASQLRDLLVGVLGRFTDTPLHSLAFGWLTAYAVLSGSPVAAFALGLMSATPPVVSTTSAYFMIMGSRLGASFIVIIIGLVAIARGAEREKSLAMGVLSFLVTYSIYLPAILLGYGLLETRALSWLQITTPSRIVGYFQLVYERPVDFVIRNTAFLPILAFVVALVAVYAGLALFDKTFHREEEAEVRSPRMHRFMRHLPVSFLVGALITLASTSVSLSIGMLVPLYLRGYVDRREIVPYIMGANITTFIDTLFAAVVLGGNVAVNLVLIEMLSVTAVSFVALRRGLRVQSGASYIGFAYGRGTRPQRTVVAPATGAGRAVRADGA